MLNWNSDWGSVREHWEKMLELGRPVPEPFLEQPEILYEAVFYWFAFLDLATERSIGMGVGPIPHSAARAYADREGLDDDEWDRFWYIIRGVDTHHLAQINKKHEDPKKPKLISVQDTEGMKAHWEGLARRHK